MSNQEKEKEAVDYNQKMLTFVLQQIQLRLEKVDVMIEAIIRDSKSLSKNKDLMELVNIYNKMINDIDNQATMAITKFNMNKED